MIRPILSALLVILVAHGVSAQGFFLTKEVDRIYAHTSDVLAYTITVANISKPAVNVGLFTDDFPNEVSGCTWTCSATGDTSCGADSGDGDIDFLIPVPIGSSMTFEVTCTFAPSPGNECAVNVAEFFHMDPDVFRQGVAITCDPWIILFGSDFDSGDTSSWSETVS